MPQVTTPTYWEYVRVLGNAVGRYCSFCERALTFQLWLFHKLRGPLAVSAQIGNNDWPNLLLICSECAASATTFTATTTYFWPDSLDAIQNPPYLYQRIDNVPVSWADDDGNATNLGTASFFLVSISTDVPSNVQAAAQATYRLFRLNGRFFNENFSSPGYTLTYDEYIHPSDTRLEDRWDAYIRALDAAQAIMRAFGTRRAGDAYARSMLAMINMGILGYGFVSTWESMIFKTLSDIGPNMMPNLIALMTNQPPPQQPVDRKRAFTQIEQGLQNAADEERKRRLAFNQALNTLIQVKS